MRIAMPKAKSAGKQPQMKMITPHYGQRSPVVNDQHFTDGPRMPTASSAGFNPGRGASALPSGPPRSIQPPGKRAYSKGLSNKRITDGSI